MKRLVLLTVALLAAGELRGAESPPPADSVYGQANAHYQRGTELLRKNDFVQAQGELEQAVGLNPRFGLAYYWLGVCEFRQGRRDAALRDFVLARSNTRDTAALATIDRSIAGLSRRNPLSRIFFSSTLALLIPLVGVFILLRVALARKAGAADQTSAPEMPVSPSGAIDRDALKRLTAGWSPETELMMSPVPRPVRFAGYKQLIISVAIVVLGSSFVVIPQGWSMYRRWTVQTRGAAGAGTFERAYRVRHSGRHGSYWVDHVIFRYTPSPGLGWRADRVVGREPRYQPGESLPLHFLADRPDWVELDDDLGYLARQKVGLYAAAGTGAAILLLTAGLMWPQLKKQRDLVIRGQTTAGWVDSVDYGPKGAASAMVCFESGGQVRRVNCAFSQQNAALKQGEVVTLLVDPENQDSVVVYRAASFRAA